LYHAEAEIKRALCRDGGDLDAGLHSAEAGFAAEVFAAAHLLDDVLFALHRAEDFGGDDGAFDERDRGLTSPEPPTASTFSNLSFWPAGTSR
jgi:hypothetical protein